jgi:hypothetical protein
LPLVVPDRSNGQGFIDCASGLPLTLDEKAKDYNGQMDVDKHSITVDVQFILDKGQCFVISCTPPSNREKFGGLIKIGQLNTDEIYIPYGKREDLMNKLQDLDAKALLNTKKKKKKKKNGKAAFSKRGLKKEITKDKLWAALVASGITEVVIFHCGNLQPLQDWLDGMCTLLLA